MKNTLLKFVVSFVVGIFAADMLDYRSFNLPQTRYIALIALSIALLGTLTALASKQKKKVWQVCFTVAALATFALLGAFRYQQTHDAVASEWPDGKRIYEATVVDGPTERKKTNRYVISIGGKTVYAYLPKSVRLTAGERLRMEAQIKPPENFAETDFDYARYLYHHKVSGTIPFIKEADMQRIGSESESKMPAVFFSRLRSQVRQRYSLFGFSDEELGILSALSIGDKSLLSDTQREVFSAAGASHVLALSGLHVGIVYLLLSTLLGRKRGTRRGRLLKEGLIVLSLWLFALLAGMSPSIVRAVTMCTIYAFVKCLGGANSSFDTLLLSAFVMLVFQPFQLFELSFQLSFGAMAGILLIPTFRPRNYFLSIVVLSLCAQLGTLPLTLHAFGVFPTYFLITNLVVMPLTYAIMLCIGLWWLASWTPLVSWLTPVLGWLVRQMNLLVGTIASLPHSQWQAVRISWEWVLILYTALALAVLLYRRLRRNVADYYTSMRID